MADIVIVLFGIVRKVTPFLDSINHALFHPLNKLGLTYRVMGQINSPAWIANPRSCEHGLPDSADLITDQFKDLVVKDQSLATIAQELENFSQYGDAWNDEYKSLSNLLFQQKSLIEGTKMALNVGAETVFFIRPDLVYHDQFFAPLLSALSDRTSRMLLPAWQNNTGLNDRFGIAVGQRSIKTYGLRLEDALNFVSLKNRPLHSERLLAFTLGTHRIPVEFITHRASRCRVDGTIKEENFSVKISRNFRTQVRLKAFPKTFAK